MIILHFHWAAQDENNIIICKVNIFLELLLNIFFITPHVRKTSEGKRSHNPTSFLGTIYTSFCAVHSELLSYYHDVVSHSLCVEGEFF